MSFSNILKTAQEANTLAATPAVASVMTLELTPENSIAAYSGDDYIRNDVKYKWFDDFVDDRYSTVDINKNISVDPSQVNISQERNSQFIPFKIPRYWDGIDLTEMTFWIHYENKEGCGDKPPVNFQYNSESILFGWLVDLDVTYLPGDVKFEIQAIGQIKSSDNTVFDYTWKTMPNGKLNIIESLTHSCKPIEPDSNWNTEVITQMSSMVSKAEQAVIDANAAADRAEKAAEEASKIAITDEDKAAIAEQAKASTLEEVAITYATKEETENLEQNIVNTYATKEELGTTNRSIEEVAKDLADNYYSKDDIDEKLGNIDISTQLTDITTRVGNVETDLSTYKETTNADLQAIHNAIDTLPSTLESDYYKSETVDTLLAEKANKTDLDAKANQTDLNAVKSTADANKTNVDALSTKVAELNDAVANVDTSPRLTYDVKYNDTEDADVGENVFAFYEITNEGQEDEVREIKQKFTIVGGSGGSSTSSSLKIGYVTKTPLVVTVDDKALITFTFSGTDSSGDEVLEAQATWKVAGEVVATSIVVSGENTFDVTDFLNIGTQKVQLSVTDDAGSLVTKNWTVQKIDVRIESTFNDAYSYGIGDVSFNYTPYGAISKDIHFVLDEKEIGKVTTSTSGIPMSYTLPSQEHGSHLLEVYITADINNDTIESNHIFKDIIWKDDTSTIPVIGCATRSINITQYNTVNIKYTVIDPKTETPEVTWFVNDEIVSTEVLSEKDKDGYYTFSYKASNSGTFALKVTCGEAEPKVITVVVEELNIDVAPVTAGLAFDFNPVGYSNNSAERLWSYNDVTMTVSDNFDWVNGGYQLDENGDQYFCVKAGTNAVINYNLFADDPKKNGKEFKTIFRTKNIRKRDTSFLSCMDGNIGLDMKVEQATVYDSGGSFRSPYCEDTIIEYEFNINKDSDMMIAMSYEDGTPSIPYEYKETSSYKQSNAQPIIIGSPDCDVHIYRMKAYSLSLTDTDIKNNFIADARNADEMLARYNRNQIYNDNGVLISTSANGGFNVDALMKAAPDLRYIFLEVPQFTNDKDNKIDGCTVYWRYPNGTRPEDNWTCTGIRHRGQGTSSNLYGYAGRNIDLCMDRDESLFTWVGADGKTVESSTITLSDTSFPTDYLNIKVNIASSENANNAELARRFNEYQPFLRYARKKDSRVKDTMEFYNCVVFIRETSTDPSVPHREFSDNNWHFYAIGNVGDSKKTDDTRVNNKRDPKEHVIEITDADKPLSAFPTGKEGYAVCPVDEWKSGNTAYDVLYSNEYVYDEEGAFESFGGKTYEFRYEMKDITDEQRQANIDTWRDLYTFIVTSSDEEFYANLKNYFVVDSALYYYLFTERYTMVDNRAKNSFWHYGKVYISNAEAIELGETEASYYIIDDEAAAINNGYRYDLTFGYDMDTALGIDNTGDFVFPYGKEDTDYYVDGDPTSDYVFRVADSVFFCRLRDLFPSEMQAMFKNREEKNAWDSNSLITQWDNSQAKFPEELWRLDYERKYYRTYLGLSIDNSITNGVDKTFLIGKFFGRKKYARRSFEINQEMYFATKYFGNKALSDVFWIRGNVPIGGNIKPNYSLTLVPYSDMYVCVQYTSTGTPIHQKVKAGQTCYFENNAERMDFIYVYAASFIQEVGDLSKCFVGDNNFSSAIRLQRLEIGSIDDGYENTFMKEVLVGNNPLLEYLDIRNISGINTVIDVSGCSNLKELYAEGTNASGVIFANGGLLETAHLPAISSLSMKNLNYIKDFVIDGYDNLHTLIVENTSRINTYEIVTSAPLLKLVRLIGLNWDITYQINDASIFDRLLTIGGIDSSGYETDLSVLTGNSHVTIMKQQQLYNYQNAWHDLEITYDTWVEQFAVSFVNADTDFTVLEVQYVDKGESAVDPTTRTENPLSPTIPSTISHDYSFTGWDKSLSDVFSDRTITAVYAESLRKYQIKYVSKGIVMPGYPVEGYYGDNIVYSGDTPIYTGGESGYQYNLFNRWDKSGFLTGDFDENGVKTVNAVYDTFTYTDGAFNNKELSDLTPVEIYAMNKLGLYKNVITDKDEYSFSIGHDFNYDDIESVEIIKEQMTFNGSNYYDTGIQLFDEDKDFVLAIDYKFTANTASSVLAQCYQGSGTVGFKLQYNNRVQVKWGSDNSDVARVNERELVVLRHKKGDTNLYVYNSNLGGDDVSIISLSSKEFAVTSTLVFGCEKQTSTIFNNYASGEIYWAKLWYADLGEDVCKQLALWTHETINFEACGFNRYFLSNNPDDMCSFSLLASNLLDRNQRWNTSNTNVGGWAQSSLNKFLNNRLYKAMPIQIKQLLKQVQIVSSIGNKSTNTSRSDCYITIPSLREINPSITTEPYASEGIPISYLAEAENRKRAYSDGTYGEYWLRSPFVDYTNYIWRVTAQGETASITSANAENIGVLILISF